MTAHILAAGLAGPVRPGLHLPPGLVAALAPVLVVLLGLDAFCLINLARSKSVRNAPKLAWISVILCVSAPLGALLYLFFGMPRNPGGRGPELAAVGVTAAAGQSPAQSTAVLGPERVFGFGSGGISAPYAEVLCEAVPVGGRMLLGTTRTLDPDKPLAPPTTRDLSGWLGEGSLRDRLGR